MILSKESSAVSYRFKESLPFEKSKLIIQKCSDIEEISAEKLFEGLIEAHTSHDDDRVQLQEAQDQVSQHVSRPSIHVG